MELPSFILKFDNLDLNYFLNRDYNVLPVWDLNARSSDYREFELLVGRIEDTPKNEIQPKCVEITNPSLSVSSQSDQDITSYETYKCILCDIDVPNMFRKEHIASQKHRTNVEIVRTVLERVNFNISNDIEINTVNKVPNIYFCKNCVIIVKDTDKVKHEASELHYKSVLQDRYLNDLQMIYKDRRYLENLDLTYLSNSDKDDNDSDSIQTEPKVKRSDGSREAGDSDDDEDNAETDEGSGEEESEELRNETKTKIKNDISDDGGGENGDSDDDLGEAEPEECSNDTFSQSDDVIEPLGLVIENPSALDEEIEKYMNKYVELLTENEGKPTHKFTLIGLHTVHIETLDKCLVEVSFDNYNGLFAIPDSNYTQCRICRIVMDDSKMDHCLNWVHVERVRKPLKNIHCYRQVDRSYKHCVLCNDNFIDVIYHQKIKGHMEALMRAVNITCRPVPRPVVSSSSIATSISTRSSETTPSNKVTSPNKYNKLKTENNNYKYIDAKPSKTQISTPSETKAPMTAIKNESKVTAKTNVPTAKTNVSTAKTKIVPAKSEVTTAETNVPTAKTIASRDKKKLTTLTVPIAKSKVNKDTANDVPPETKVNSNKSLDNPVETTNKTATKSLISNIPYYFKLGSKTTECLVCLKIVPFSDRNIREHIIGMRHKTAYNKLLNNNKIKHKNKKFFCDVCYVVVDMKMELEHIASVAHKTMIERTRDTANVNESDTIKKYNKNKPTKNVPGAKEMLHHHFKDTVNKQYMLCKVCETTLCVNKYTEHLKSYNHISQYKTLLNENELKKKKTGYRCKYCNRMIRFEDDLDHIKSVLHISKKSALLEGKAVKGAKLNRE